MKSLKLNMILNTIRGLLRVLFPLITFPYVSKVLGVESVGAYNFALSIITYFVYLANLGITDYGTRNAAYVRDDKKELETFVSEVYTINLISMAVSYIALILSIFLIGKLSEYKLLLLVLSIDIPLRVIGVEWVFGAKEEYTYITIRSIIFQIISLILLFALVHKPEDCVIYAAITVFSSAGSNILNRIKVREYCKIRVTRRPNLKKHLKPILYIFATSIASTIYVNSDVTLLGIFCGDSTVGVYSVSVKVYTIVKSLLASTFVVAVPRMSSYFAKGDFNKFEETGRNVLSILSSLTFPAIVGLIVLSKQIILIVSNPDYIAAQTSFVILSVALIFSLGSWFISYCILIPTGSERTVLIATMISAIVNVSLNIILINVWKEIAAAITTVISELICFIIVFSKSTKYITYKNIMHTLGKIIVGSLMIMPVNCFISYFKMPLYLHTASVVMLSIVVYFAIEVILKNDSIKGLRSLRKE